MSWQPIETAPQAVRVLLYKRNTAEIYVASYVHSEVMGSVWATPDAHVIFGATHWMPLPSLPGDTE